jgi:CheY-like chemotaxis protein
MKEFRVLVVDDEDDFRETFIERLQMRDRCGKRGKGAANSG